MRAGSGAEARLADGPDGVLQEGDALGEPGQFLVADGVVGGVPGLDIGAAEPVEGLAVEAAVAGPDDLEAVVQGLGLGAQEGDAVALGAVQGQHQQDAVVERLDGLMERERCVLGLPVSDHARHQ